MAAKDQIHDLFQNMGMRPEKIRYNDNLDVYRVNIGVEGTEERFYRDIHEIGGSEPVDFAVDTDKLKGMVSRIQGAEIPEGTVNVTDTMRDSHFRIEVVE